MTEIGTTASHTDYLSAKETTALLGIKLQTLYAYVSRGLIRSTSLPGQKARIYLRADVERVHARAVARSGHGPVAGDAMNHGQPIIPTSITEITERGPSYRGHLAVDLARQPASFESVAELLWLGQWNPSSHPWSIAAPPDELVQLVETLGRTSNKDQLLEVFALATLHLGLGQQPNLKRKADARMLSEALQIIGVLTGCCGLISERRCFVPLRKGQRIAQGLLQALGGEVSEVHCDAINTMLTLLADHELSPGTLSARVSASGGATLHGCIASALCASSGANVAQVFEHVHDFLSGASSKSGLLKQATSRLARGEAIPGFIHPLYPQGDPRAQLLLAFIRNRMPTRTLLAVCDFVDEIEKITGLHVRHEVPMVALTRAMGLPRLASGAIFLLARTAGWVAHIREQRLTGQLMRPRAKFVQPDAIARA